MNFYVAHWSGQMFWILLRILVYDPLLFTTRAIPIKWIPEWPLERHDSRVEPSRVLLIQAASKEQPNRWNFRAHHLLSTWISLFPDQEIFKGGWEKEVDSNTNSLRIQPVSRNSLFNIILPRISQYVGERFLQIILKWRKQGLLGFAKVTATRQQTVLFYRRYSYSLGDEAPLNWVGWADGWCAM